MKKGRNDEDKSDYRQDNSDHRDPDHHKKIFPCFFHGCINCLKFSRLLIQFLLNFLFHIFQLYHLISLSTVLVLQLDPYQITRNNTMDEVKTEDETKTTDAPVEMPETPAEEPAHTDETPAA